MAQTEKKAGLLRRTSSSKKPLKEKVLLMYEDIFTEDPTKSNPRFWDELFLMKVNLEHLEGKLEALDGDEVVKIRDNINSLFHHCVQALAEEHQIKVVNALQTLCALFRGVHQKNKSATGFDIINMLMGFDKAELRMKELMESLDSLLCGDGSESLKSLCLKLLLCLVTVTDNISQNTILEYVMINSIFEAILQILSDVSSRARHGYDAVVLLALLVNYRKYESVNPYIVKLSIVDDEPTLDGLGRVIHHALAEYNRQYKEKEEENQGGFFSTLTSMVGSMFIADADEKLSVQTNEAILLALYEAVHLNRNFITVLAQSHPEIDIATAPAVPIPASPTTPLGTTPPSLDMMNNPELPLDPNLQTSNLLITFLKYSSIVMQDTKDEHRLNSARLCLIILTCIAEDQYADAFLHDDNMNFRVNLHRMPMRHRKKAVDKSIPSRPLVCAVLDLMVEFIFPFNLRCVQIIHKLICYQKKCRVRIHYTWRELWSGMIFTFFVLLFILFFLACFFCMYFYCIVFFAFLFIFDFFHFCFSFFYFLFLFYFCCILFFVLVFNLFLFILFFFDIFILLFFCFYLTILFTFELYYEASALFSVLVTFCFFHFRAIINHFNPKIESYATVNHISQLSEDQVLEVVRTNYDTLTLKLQDGLDQFERYSEQPREAGFFKELVRSISLNVRKNVSLSTMSQDVLLKEFSSIS
uniref:Armadillo like helical domain containing 3 n=1 Tax=Cyprinus carpio TaxID=7962 RepID=A0A8C1XHH7_CYPCA